MEKSRGTKRSISRPSRYMPIFPLLVLVIYVVLFILNPEQALVALKSSGKVCLTILPSLALVFGVMLVLNLFIKPARIVRLLGSGTNIKGILLSVVTGIISMGPIYVWYPLLKELREKGAGNMLIAVFLYNRAVKPFLLPVMITYFGWVYVALLTVFTILASVVQGYIIGIFTRRETG
ncbi:MAG TPA: permease [Dehalococcoidia bacterium]|nr:permease [Dehalococcoidia bacterium]